MRLIAKFTLKHLPMTSLSRLVLAFAIVVLFSGCAENVANMRWTKTETSKTERKVRPPNNQIGRWGTQETTMTCYMNYQGSSEESRHCDVTERYIPPPEKKFSGGFFERMAKGLLDDLVGGWVDATVDRLNHPDGPQPGNEPSNMTVLPSIEAPSKSSMLPLAQSPATNSPEPTGETEAR